MAFTKGQSGNPAGRPKGAVNRTTAISQAIIDAMQANDGELAAKFGSRLVEMAMEGNSAAIKTVVDRAEGLLGAEVDITSGGESIADDGRRFARLVALVRSADASGT